MARQEMEFKLKVISAVPLKSREDFEKLVREKILETEMQLNSTGIFRFHFSERTVAELPDDLQINTAEWPQPVIDKED